MVQAKVFRTLLLWIGFPILILGSEYGKILTADEIERLANPTYFAVDSSTNSSHRPQLRAINLHIESHDHPRLPPSPVGKPKRGTGSMSTVDKTSPFCDPELANKRIFLIQRIDPGLPRIGDYSHVFSDEEEDGSDKHKHKHKHKKKKSKDDGSITRKASKQPFSEQQNTMGQKRVKPIPLNLASL